MVNRIKKLCMAGACVAACLTLMAIFLRVDGAWCEDCGKRVEKADLFGLPVLSTDHDCRLSFIHARNSGNMSPCVHQKLTAVEKGGCFLLLKYHPPFCEACSRRND